MEMKMKTLEEKEEENKKKIMISCESIVVFQ